VIEVGAGVYERDGVVEACARWGTWEDYFTFLNKCTDFGTQHLACLSFGLLICRLGLQIGVIVKS
jgi:hypothetical protein